MSSYSTSDGSMALTITFKLGTNLDQANVLVQNRVSTALPRMPAEVRTLGVTTRKSSPDLMMVVHMLSPSGAYDQLYISNYALLRVRDALLRLDGVGDLTVFGAREYAIRVWLDPDKLASYGLAAGDVVRALQEQNVQVSGGALGGQPAPSDSAFQLTVQTQGALRGRAPVPERHREKRRRGPARPRPGRRPRRARRPRLRDEFLSRREAGGRARDLPAPRNQRARRRHRDHRPDGRAEARLSRGDRIPHRLQPDGVHRPIGRRGL